MNQFKHSLLLIFVGLPILMKSQNCGISLIQTPVSSTRCSGDTLTLFASYAGQNLSYQWRKNGSNIPNATNARLFFPSVTTADNGSYDVIVSTNGCPSQTSPPATVSIKETPPAPYIGEHNGFCGCESVTGKAQHRDAFFQPIPNLTFVWYDNINRQGNSLPSVMDGSISLHTSFRNNTVYAFEIANGCYSPPSRLDLTVFNLPNRTPKVFRGNSTEELADFVPISSCEPITLNAIPSIPNGRISWYKSSNRSQLISVSNTLVCDTSQTVFVFDEPENNICSSASSETLQCFGKPKEVRIIILPRPTVSLGADLVLCDSNSSKVLTANVSNTTHSNLIYTWSTGANTPSIVVNTANTYRVTVTNNDFFRCSVSDEVIVSKSNFSIQLNAQQTVCANSVTTLNVTTTSGQMPFVYNWSNGQTTPSVNVGIGSYQVTVTDNNGCIRIAESKVLQSNILGISLGDDKTVCGNNTTTLTAIISGGTAPFSYSWSNNQTTPSVSVGVGSYQVTVTDSNGCSGSDQVQVQQSTRLTVNAGEDQTVCGSDSTTITATVLGGTAPFKYIWNNNQTIPSINVGIGSYQVTVTDANGCSGSDSIEVASGGNGNISAFIDSKNNFCHSANDGAILIKVLRGRAPYSYSIDGGVNWHSNPFFFNLKSGNYTVVVKEIGGCAFTQTVYIKEPEDIKFVVNSQTSCRSGSLKIENVTGGTGRFYHYSINYGISWQDSNTFYNLPNTSYYIRVRDSVGCISAIQRINLQPQNILFSIKSENGNCEQGGSVKIENIVGGIAPYQYSIDGGNSWQENPIFSNLNTGIYALRVKDATQCLSNSQLTTIRGGSFAIQINQNNNLCYGSSDASIYINVFGGFAPYQYSIDNGQKWQTSPYFSSLLSGVYSIKVKDTSGCVISQNINIKQNPELIFTTTNQSVSCENTSDGLISFNSVSGGSGSGYQFSIDFGSSFQTSNIFKNLAVGKYNVRIKDGLGCLSVARQLEISFLSPIVFQTSTYNGSCGSKTNGVITVSNISGGNAPYKYSKDGGLTYQNDNAFFFLSTGTYPIRVQDIKGCQSVIQNITLTRNCDVANASQNNRPTQGIPVVIYGVSPNPTTDFISVELNSLEKRHIYFEFFDALGRLSMIEKRAVELGIQKLEFNVSELSTGIYQIHAKDSYARNVSNRFVKQ
ncbi:MAG: SprB repeat-containing protein [Saprospiraceae bacterium]|nr:SprB repeat-containing protein [Saprospiraceae bacterium]